MQKSLFPWIAAFLALPASAEAADATAEADEGNRDLVVVTATRIPTPESEVASSMTVITADDVAAKQSQTDRKSTRLNSSHLRRSRMPSSA